MDEFAPPPELVDGFISFVLAAVEVDRKMTILLMVAKLDYYLRRGGNRERRDEQIDEI